MIRFLHEHSDFKDLLAITANAVGVQDPALVEKDYWLMHVLWGLQQQKLNFQLKGGTSLSKGHGCIHRFSEDIDLKIDPDEAVCGFKIFANKNHDDKKHRDSRQKYFDWVATFLRDKIPGIIEVHRESTFDDLPKYRSGGIRLIYSSHFSAIGLKEGILLEVGFDRAAPNSPLLISSWAFDRAVATAGVTLLDNRAKDVLCYEPRYTFVAKLQGVIRKFRLFKEAVGGANLPANFIRHYYDLYQLIDRADVQQFIGTQEYEDFKKERFGGDDTKIINSDALKLNSPADRALFEREYNRSASLYFKGRPTLVEILNRFAKDIDRL